MFSPTYIHRIAFVYQTLCWMLWVNNESIQDVKPCTEGKNTKLFLHGDTNASTGNQEMFSVDR